MPKSEDESHSSSGNVFRDVGPKVEDPSKPKN